MAICLVVAVASSQSLASGLQGYNFMLTPQANASLRNIAQQQAFAQGLTEQGSKGVDTSNRSIGGVGYAVSPFEGLNKVAQSIIGAYETKDANNQVNNLFNPQPQAAPSSVGEPQPLTGDASGGGQPQVGAPGFQQLPDQQPQQPQGAAGGGQGPFDPNFMATLQQVQQKYNLTPFEAMTVLQDPAALGRVIAANAPTGEMKNAQYAYGAQGAPGAVANIMNYQQYPGQKTMQEGLGTAAAGQAPAGQLPAGPGAGGPMPAPPPRPAATFPPQPSGYSVQNDGIHLPAPAPQAAGGIQGLPQGAADTLQNAVTPVSGSALAATGGGTPGGMAPINPAGLSNAQYTEAIKAQGAGAAAQAEQTGKNVAEANKGVASIDSRIDNAKAIIQEMKTLAPQVPYGPHGMAEAQVDFSNTPLIGSGKAAGAHNRFETLNQNLFTQELPAVVQSSGGRIDIPLVKAIQAASSVDIDAHPNAKAQALEELSSLLDKVQQNAKNYQGSLTGQPPSPAASGWSIKRAGQ